jgi:predicted methyltransferase
MSAFKERNQELFMEDDLGNEIFIPSKYEVCGRCEGRGTHVNEAIDGNGITGSEMAELCHDDPDFSEDYFSGKYDVTCTACNGKRVTLEPDFDRMPASMQKDVQDALDAEHVAWAERQAEIRMGA